MKKIRKLLALILAVLLIGGTAAYAEPNEGETEDYIPEATLVIITEAELEEEPAEEAAEPEAEAESGEEPVEESAEPVEIAEDPEAEAEPEKEPVEEAEELKAEAEPREEPVEEAEEPEAEAELEEEPVEVAEEPEAEAEPEEEPVEEAAESEAKPKEEPVEAAEPEAEAEPEENAAEEPAESESAVEAESIGEEQENSIPEAALVIITEAADETAEKPAKEAAEKADEPAAKTEEKPAESEKEAQAKPEVTAAAEKSGDKASKNSSEAANKPAETAVSKNGAASDNVKGAQKTSKALKTSRGSLSKKTIIIKSVDVTEVPTNTDYVSLSFSFGCKGDKKVYEGLITGLKLQYLDGKPHDFDYVLTLVSDIADSFYAEKSMKLSDSTGFSDKYSLLVRPIDAEKVHDTGTQPTSDSQLCWAASASDMLQYTGWAKLINDGQSFKTEDDILDYFEACYTDAGSSQDRGAKWFFNGINSAQVVDNDGTVTYGGDSKTSQERLPESGKQGGLLNGTAAESFVTYYDVTMDGLDPLYDAAMSLKDGTAVGLGIFFYNDKNEYHGGHAISLFGYIKDAVETGINALKALFIADSDNDKYTAPERSGMVDSVTMYPVGEWTGIRNDKEVTTKCLSGYTEDNSPILDYTTLTPYTDNIPLEGEGKKDPVNYIDFTPDYIAVEDSNEKVYTEVEVGDLMLLSAGIKNVSYTGIDLTDIKEPYLRGEFIVSSGESVTSVPAVVYLGSGGCRPLASNYFTKEYRFTQPGTYSVSFTLDGIFYDDADGDVYRLNEAFYNNNITGKTFTINVKPMSGSGDEEGGDYQGGGSYELVPENDAKKPAAAGDRLHEAVPGFEENFVYEEGGSYFSTLQLPEGGGYSLVKDGTPVDSALYTISKNTDGSFTVTFAPEFIKSIAPGSAKLSIRNASGETVAILTLNVR